ncbi:MAG: ABC transporter permease [Anaerolineae bacterium]|nr:ABC transporter permease [Anaerolineae bacterium]MDW8097880.1 ABC transporter permease [Anaerolineae bacterium]
MASRHPVLMYLLKRIAVYLITVWGAFTVAFVFFRLVPGDPIGSFAASMMQRYGQRIQDAEAMIQAYRQMLGLDGSLFHQYIRYLSNVFLHLNFGPSLIAFPTPAIEHILRALPWTIGLLGLSTVIAWTLGFVIGGLVGFRRDSPISATLTNLAIVLSQIPPYFMALALLFLLAYSLQWLPTRGAYAANVTPALNWAFIASVIRHGTLPALSIIFISVSGWLISTRSLVISILGEDYLLFAEAKGLKRGWILTRYVLRNAMLPQVTGLAMSLGFVMNGFFLVEWVFNYPGLGTLFLNAIGMLDYNVVQGIVLMSITVILTATLLIDLLLPLVDPRVRMGGSR